MQIGDTNCRGCRRLLSGGRGSCRRSLSGGGAIWRVVLLDHAELTRRYESDSDAGEEAVLGGFRGRGFTLLERLSSAVVGGRGLASCPSFGEEI